MNDQVIVKHLQRIKPGEEDVLLIKGEPFYVRKATSEDLEAVKESVKRKEE